MRRYTNMKRRCNPGDAYHAQKSSITSYDVYIISNDTKVHAFKLIGKTAWRKSNLVSDTKNIYHEHHHHVQYTFNLLFLAHFFHACIQLVHTRCMTESRHVRIQNTLTHTTIVHSKVAAQSWRSFIRSRDVTVWVRIIYQCRCIQHSCMLVVSYTKCSFCTHTHTHTCGIHWSKRNGDMLRVVQAILLYQISNIK